MLLVVAREKTKLNRKIGKWMRKAGFPFPCTMKIGGRRNSKEHQNQRVSLSLRLRRWSFTVIYNKRWFKTVDTRTKVVARWKILYISWSAAGTRGGSGSGTWTCWAGGAPRHGRDKIICTVNITNCRELNSTTGWRRGPRIVNKGDDIRAVGKIRETIARCFVGRLQFYLHRLGSTHIGVPVCKLESSSLFALFFMGRRGEIVGISDQISFITVHR